MRRRKIHSYTSMPANRIRNGQNSSRIGLMSASGQAPGIYTTANNSRIRKTKIQAVTAVRCHSDSSMPSSMLGLGASSVAAGWRMVAE